MRGLVNKVVVVAGAGGIGSATARRLAQGGAHVVLGDLDGEHAETVASEIESGISRMTNLNVSSVRLVRVRMFFFLRIQG